MLFSADETTDVGQDNASPVSDDYTPAGSRFTGTVHWVRIDLGDDNDDHFITPEQRMAIAMIRQ
jgi:arylsulfatase